MNLHKSMNGHQSGIANSNLRFMNFPELGMKFPSVTVDIPDYHNIILGEEATASYHLVGYGKYHEEALVRVIGETAERYALATSSTYAKQEFITASYNDLAGEDDVLPWEYINIFSEDNYEDFKKANTKFVPITKDDKISWLKSPSLFSTDRKVYIPAQFLYTGLSLDEPKFMTGFSKGTAAHRSPKKALHAALVEAIEADAMMLKWYTDLKSPIVEIDDPIVRDLCKEITGEISCYPVFSDLSMPEFPVHVFNTMLKSKNGERPTVLYGLGAGLEPKQAAYRTYTEALAIYNMGRNTPVALPSAIVGSDNDMGELFADLDSNVAFWSSNTNAAEKLKIMDDRLDGNVKLSALQDYSTNTDKEIATLLEKIQKVSKYAVAYEITPVELIGSGWNVMRVFIPEMVQLCLPSFPYSQHPRMLQYGGVTNKAPHALP